MEQLELIKVNRDHVLNSLCLSNIFRKYNLVFDEELGKMRFRVDVVVVL